MPAAYKKKGSKVASDFKDQDDALEEGAVREGSADRVKGRRKDKTPCGCSDCKSGKACPCSKKDASGAKPRSDALTPQEYLDACDLGIQGRSRTYIRARLDTATRFDLRGKGKACGASHIPSTHNCSVGTAGAAAAKPTGGGKAAARGRFEKIVNPKNSKEMQAGVAWQKAKGPTNTTGQKVMKAGEKAARIGGTVAVATGVARAVFGSRVGDINRGMAQINLGVAAHRVASASKAARMGDKNLRNEFLKSAGRQAALGGLNLGIANAGERLMQRAAANQQARRRSTGTGEAPPPRNTYKGDPFKDLGVNSRASDTEIRNAWKASAKKNHPDMGGDAETMKKVNTAYEEIMRRRGRKDFWADGIEFDFSV
jgi:hypothetical protein